MNRLLFVAAVLVLCAAADGRAQCIERHGWVKPGPYPAFVTRSPAPDSVVVGVIKPRAAVAVCDPEYGWVRVTDPAPVRDAKGQWLDCKPGCYMRAEHFSITFPGK